MFKNRRVDNCICFGRAKNTPSARASRLAVRKLFTLSNLDRGGLGGVAATLEACVCGVTESTTFRRSGVTGGEISMLSALRSKLHELPVRWVDVGRNFKFVSTSKIVAWNKTLP